MHVLALGHFCWQIPLVLHKEPDLNDRGQHMVDADGRLRYRCGFRIGGGIDQDPTVSPQGYPDKALCLHRCCFVLLEIYSMLIRLLQRIINSCLHWFVTVGLASGRAFGL